MLYLDPAEIRAILKSTPAIHCFESVDSTSSYAKDFLKELGGELLICSMIQTAGRGRNGNSFDSSKRSCYFTFTKKLGHFPEERDLFTVKAACAVYKTFKDLFNIDLGIKWVNDLFYNGKKCGGILCECCYRLGDYYLLIGIGMNINVNLSPDLEDFATSLWIDNFNLNEVIATIINNYNDLVDQDEIIKMYEDHLLLLGKTVSFNYQGKLTHGVVLGINKYGHLLIDHNGEKLVLDSGVISLKSKNIAKLIPSKFTKGY